VCSKVSTVYSLQRPELLHGLGDPQRPRLTPVLYMEDAAQLNRIADQLRSANVCYGLECCTAPTRHTDLSLALNPTNQPGPERWPGLLSAKDGPLIRPLYPLSWRSWRL
jgi:hypothetical protein